MQSHHDERHPDDHLRRKHGSPDATPLKSNSSAHPLTPQMIATLENAADSAGHTGAVLAFISVIVAVVLLILGLMFARGCDPALVLIPGALIALIATIASRRKGASLRADIEGGVYLSVSGPISYHIVEPEAGQDGGETYFFRVDGEDFPITSRTWYEIRYTAWGVVDYAPHSRRVFALRDEANTIVYAS